MVTREGERYTLLPRFFCSNSTGRLVPNFQASFLAKAGLVTVLDNTAVSRPGKPLFLTSYIQEQGG